MCNTLLMVYHIHGITLGNTLYIVYLIHGQTLNFSSIDHENVSYTSVY